jgi:hypothetical protein
MIEIVLAHSDLARVRFAHSPIEELVASLRVLQDPAASSCTAGGWRPPDPGWTGCGWSC